MRCCDCWTNFWAISPAQAKRDPHYRARRVAIFATAIFAILAITFCCLMFDPAKPLKFYLPLFGSSVAAIFIPIPLTNGIYGDPTPPPPPPKEEEKDDD